ncbi:hypothetical protein AAFF_G00232180 [Aldrovandia affinis]|uniref:Uncharacterized protein n=1 Tax=Aldrovandia affinis TaxID=143900 RepID=A0AAD7RHQ3_9TELE|nr:hypothetical protein AAFF_G00232180 [Aldrovandia affinis]
MRLRGARKGGWCRCIYKGHCSNGSIITSRTAQGEELAVNLRFTVAVFKSTLLLLLVCLSVRLAGLWSSLLRMEYYTFPEQNKSEVQNGITHSFLSDIDHFVWVLTNSDPGINESEYRVCGQHEILTAPHQDKTLLLCHVPGQGVRLLLPSRHYMGQHARTHRILRTRRRPEKEALASEALRSHELAAEPALPVPG